MKVNLPNGKQVKVFVKHTDDEILVCHNEKMENLRGTHIRLIFEDEQTFEARSICKPPDQFSRLNGRKLAAQRLFEMTGNVLTREDRKVLWKVFCPKFVKNN